MSIRFERANTEAIDLGTAVNLPGTNNKMCVDAWFKPATTVSAHIISKSVDATSAGTTFALTSSSSGLPRLILQGTQVTGVTVMMLNIWHHLLGDYDGSNIRIYLDGNLEGTIAKGGNVLSSAQNCRIGSAGHSSTVSNVNGDIYRPRIFNRSMSTPTVSEVPSIFEALGADTVVEGIFYEFKLTENADNVNVGSGVIVNSGPQTLANGSGEGAGGNLPSWQDMDLQIYKPAA